MPNDCSRKISPTLVGLKSIEAYSVSETELHRLSASVKILATLIFVVSVISFSAYDVSGLLPMLVYPVVLSYFARVPLLFFCKRALLALPFVLFTGIANLFFDKTKIDTPFGFEIQAGVVSFIVLVLKTFLTVFAVLLLAATTPLNKIASGLRRFKIPCVLVLQFMLTCRYIEVVLSEAWRMLTAYLLRAPKQKFVRFLDWHMLAGSLFLRSLDRAERVYGAMLCRGFNARTHYDTSIKETWRDIFFLILFSAMCIFTRAFNISEFFGKIFTC